MDQQRKKNMTFGFVAFAGLHLLCCGIPLLLFAGVSFSFVSSVWPVAGALLFALGMALLHKSAEFVIPQTPGGITACSPP